MDQSFASWALRFVLYQLCCRLLVIVESFLFVVPVECCTFSNVWGRFYCKCAIVQSFWTSPSNYFVFLQRVLRCSWLVSYRTLPDVAISTLLCAVFSRGVRDWTWRPRGPVGASRGRVGRQGSAGRCYGCSEEDQEDQVAGRSSLAQTSACNICRRIVIINIQM